MATQWTIRWYHRIADIDRLLWDALAVPLATPLLEWQWLHQLEASGSIAPSQGWQPCHLTVWDGKALIGAAPFYIKAHSDGEFVFDHGWAQLAYQLGLTYYPKLVGMSPVTPAMGYRFLCAPQTDQVRLLEVMLDAVDSLCQRLGLSGSHLHFVDPQWEASLPRQHFIGWQHQSYLWRNQGFRSFDDYLAQFNTNQRRNIRRERRSMQRQDVDIQAFRGDEIPMEWSDRMYTCYLDTNQRYGPWAAKFLNADFFSRLFRHHRRHLLVMAAFQDAQKNPLALSLLLVKSGRLIGRYWGAIRPVKDLHFNMCFYAPIDWAIANGIESFDPGAGSPHKIYRGFKAVPQTSLHRFYNSQMQTLFQRHIDEINALEQSNIMALNSHLPFVRGAEAMHGVSEHKPS